MKLYLFTASVLIFTFCNNGFAANYYVNDGSLSGDYYCTVVGNNGNNGLTPATPKATLSNLLSVYAGSLTAGDVIYVDAGTYSDNNLTLSINGISIIGAGPAKTKFDNNFASSDLNRLFTVTGDNIVLQGFYVTEYNFLNDASAILISGANNLQVNNVLCDENKQGGGSSTIVVNGGSTVTFNGGGSSCNAHTSIAGGGVNVEGRNNNVTLNNYLFTNNKKSVQAGSGLYVKCDNGSTTVNVNQSIFADNENSTSAGGGGAFITGATVNFSNCCFSNNEAGAVSSTNYGGAISVGRGATLNISNCTFTGNAVTSTSNGGAIAINPVSIAGGGSGNSTVNLNTCSFSGNTAASGNHLYTTDVFSNAGIFNVNNCTFVAPAAGISIRSDDSGATVTISNSGNPSNSGTGGSIVFLNTLNPSSTASPSCPVLQGSCYGVILPVELVTFSAECQETYTDLHWSTASEHNNAFFTVEHAGEDGQFTLLNKVEGQLNKTTRTDYHLTDFYAQPGTNYYRLSQTDTDGRTKDLGTISLQNDCLTAEAAMSCVYAADENAFVIGYHIEESELYNIQIFNSMGQLLFETEELLHASDRTFKLNVKEHLSSGVYFVQLSSGNVLLSDKVMVNK